MNRTRHTVVPAQSLPPRSRGRVPIPGRCHRSYGNGGTRTHFHTLMWLSQYHCDSSERPVSQYSIRGRYPEGPGVAHGNCVNPLGML